MNKHDVSGGLKLALLRGGACEYPYAKEVIDNTEITRSDGEEIQQNSARMVRLIELKN